MPDQDNVKDLGSSKESRCIKQKYIHRTDKAHPLPYLQAGITRSRQQLAKEAHEDAERLKQQPLSLTETAAQKATGGSSGCFPLGLLENKKQGVQRFNFCPGSVRRPTLKSTFTT